jgi:hypothetical protein
VKAPLWARAGWVLAVGVLLILCVGCALGNAVYAVLAIDDGRGWDVALHAVLCVMCAAGVPDAWRDLRRSVL